MPHPLADLSADDHAAGAGKLSERARQFIRRVVAPWARVMHRPTLEGLENLPRDRPFLLVANHSAGLAISEIACLATMFVEQAPESQRLAGFAHAFGFRVPLFRDVLRACGAVPSTYEAGAATLAAGIPLLVFPGGDHETLRPVWQHARVDFGGRVGFKMAERAGVPIVPMGIRGSHLTAPILWRSSRILPRLFVFPKRFGFKRFAITAFGVVGAVVLATRPWSLRRRALTTWAWLGSPLVFLPVLPVTVKIRIGKALEPDELFSDETDVFGSALKRVQSEVQAIVSSLA